MYSILYIDGNQKKSNPMNIIYYDSRSLDANHGIEDNK